MHFKCCKSKNNNDLKKIWLKTFTFFLSSAMTMSLLALKAPIPTTLPPMNSLPAALHKALIKYVWSLTKKSID